MHSIPAAIVAGQVAAKQANRPLSVFDMFRVGVGPSSSHTVGPMKAGHAYTTAIAEHTTAVPERITIELFGSLGATGRGHWTDRAVLIGLAGYRPDTVPTQVVDEIMDRVVDSGTITVAGIGDVPFTVETDMIFSPRIKRPYHVNALEITAYVDGGRYARTYYSIGGGFIMQDLSEDPATNPQVVAMATAESQAAHARPAPHPFSTANELLDICRTQGARISDIVWENEVAARPDTDVINYITSIRDAMADCIDAGITTDGILPGGLSVRRRAPSLHQELKDRTTVDSLSGMDWVNLWALAVNEENASGHRVVTAPTNGAAGIVPAVFTYYCHEVADATEDSKVRFFLAATAIGALIKTNASIAGAEVGCQGEVGSASAMAAAGLAEALGGTPEQVENAAEIAMEHNLGLTCDPVGGLVQIPCIERNAIGAVKAINAARLALWGDGQHSVSFDTVIETMRQTGADMHSKYKETSEGGLAVNVVEC
ncbi:L-serine ammonia-lyase [Flaviflexus massiliensis]|uniref:L-serine ammonia-lyase n=1 Tax=Flaviflexus massiliensis TaxID=1522309 RepID=UPI0006D5820D|nr:L-serine ammonia-lyase [Flaviflexus massiliensis]